MDYMKALVKTSTDHAEIQKVPVPESRPGEVMVKVRAAALCGTDLHILAWNDWAQGANIKLPFILGHECCGDIVAVGDGVTGLAVGDRVAVETHIPCGHCDQCLNGEQHICNNLTIYGVHTNGCFAEYTVVPAVCARKIPHEINYDYGSVMEPVGTAFRAVWESQVGGGNVLVMGCGPIGLFAVAAAKKLGANLTIAVDISNYRLDIAQKVGADITLNPQSGEIIDEVRRHTRGYGVDVVIEASGSMAAVKQSFQVLRKGGTLALIGLPGQPVALDLGKDIVFKEAKVIGVHGRRMFSTWTRIERLLQANQLNVGPVLTHVLPLEQWQKGVELAQLGQACKVIFNF